EEPLALGLGERLGIAHLVDAPVSRQHRRADRERPRPGTAADLVDTDDDLVALIPKLMLHAERRRARAHHGRSVTPAGPVSTSPMGVNPACSALPPASGAIAASKPPEVWGSKQSASTASLTLDSTRP